MKFYRVRYSQDGGNSGGYSWHSNRDAAIKALLEAIKANPDEYKTYKPEIDAIDVDPTKAGLLQFMSDYASYPDNG